MRVLDISINEKRVGLSVDVLHHDLETIETLGFRDLDFATETLNQIFIDNAIR